MRGVACRRRHGGIRETFLAFLQQHPQFRLLLFAVILKPVVVTQLAGIVISLSGLGPLLNPTSPDFVPAVGWVSGTLQWLAQVAIPVSLFANGAWICGKRVFVPGSGLKVGGREGQCMSCHLAGSLDSCCQNCTLGPAWT